MQQSEIDAIEARLAELGVANPAREAASVSSAIDGGAQVALEALYKRRAGGTPLGIILGRDTFLGVQLLSDDGALAPREETELLAYTAIEELGTLDSASVRVIDMCCGAGNLACAIAVRRPEAEVWASDLTDGCVSLARRNVEQLELVERVHVAQGDLFESLRDRGLEGTVDLVVCNPPYISSSRLDDGDRQALLEHEPREAFDGGPYGLSIHQKVIKAARDFLRPGGWLMFEFGLGQARQVAALFKRGRVYEVPRMVADDAGNDRVAMARKNDV